MRLKNIKLAGFKSFVDPTTVHFPSDLVAIIGPNGCGKSNIIDAVRWVMGESSAKQLRGESMADVIFNGSSARQPLAKASVELHFDNSDASLGGEYAKYADIAIQREVTLDGQSNYYLNGVRCRRRDITDIFLGTGLGARSYAIIRQDTISRIIEAKPDELRVFLEEAAGISRYKERRKETESRIKHTRENLSRLEDLRFEIEKQLEHLERQAKAAERYKTYKTEENLLKAQTLALNWRALAEKVSAMQTQALAQENLLEAAIAAQRSTEASLEKQRDTHIEVNEQFNHVQADYYKISADIARLEQNVQHSREREQQMQVDQLQLEQEWGILHSHAEADKSKASQLQQRITELTPEVEQINLALDSTTAQLALADNDVIAWQSTWNDFTQAQARNTQQAEVSKTQLLHIEQQLSQAKQRTAKLTQELQQCKSTYAPQELQTLAQRVQKEDVALTEAKQRLTDLNQVLQQQRVANTKREQELAELRSQLQATQGQHASLTLLQQAALGQRDQAIIDWLDGQQLTDKPRLAQTLQIEAGWEHALETVLGDYLQAVCVPELAASSYTALNTLTEGKLCLLQTQASIPLTDANLLAAKIKQGPDLTAWLHGVYVANDLAQALAMRAKLQPHESVITPEGVWLGAAWLRFAKPSDKARSILATEQELAALNQKLTSDETQVQAMLADLTQGQAAQLELEQKRDVLQSDINQLTQSLAKVRSEHSVLTAKHEQLTKREQQLTQELQELDESQVKQQQDYHAIRQQWQQAVTLLEQQAQHSEQLSAQGNALRISLQQAKENRERAAQQAYQHNLEIEGLHSQLQAISQNDSRLQQQTELLSQKRQYVAQQLAKCKEPLLELESELAAKLQQQVQASTAMQQVRQRLSTIEEQLHSLENDRHLQEEKISELRQAGEEERLAKQTILVRQTTIEEQFLGTEYELNAVLVDLPTDAELELWQTKLDALQTRIVRLGAINLAAIEECSALAERKQYLDAQNKDLIEALTTLENAISKIDQETKTKFKTCLAQVNQDFQHLFPRIFGGGEAGLELTEDDVLSAGVRVKARPPGKRNASIHLLSGGEKALTAIALVFAIFQLNPAPFCMLDEVDAPLDDANVIRFNKLVEEMSRKVQFIFITHNKVTMEMAQQLLGVTMNEPGVSRLVSVDVEQAMALAEA